RQPAAALYQPIGQRRFTVVDVCNDRKIADVLHSNAVARSAGRTAHEWATRILTRKGGEPPDHPLCQPLVSASAADPYLRRPTAQTMIVTRLRCCAATPGMPAD